MKIERTKNAFRNIVFGIILKFYQVIIPFLLRTEMIRCLGLEYVGLNSIFSSVLQVLSLAELGVGVAMVFSMYKPIAMDDTEKINALMALYRKYYRIIGWVIFIGGLLIIPFLPNVIKGELPADINLYVLYALNLWATVLSYWLFAYKNCLINAYQRTDISSKILIVTSTIQYCFQAIAIYSRNYYAYVLTTIFVQIVTNVATSVIVNKAYPQYRPEGELSKGEVKIINRKIKDLFTSKIGSVILNAGNTLVISAFLGVHVVGIYQNYYYIMSSIMSFIAIALSSITAGLGNSLVTETKQKNYNTFNSITFLIAWISGFCSTSFLCLYQPFMTEWIGKEGVLPFGIVICLIFYFYVYEINQMLNIFKDAAGIWHEDRFRPLVVALTNLSLNLLTVQSCGLYGVVLSTPLSICLIGIPWILGNIFRTVFTGCDKKKFIRKLLLWTVINALFSMVCFLITCQLPFTWLFIMLRLIIIFVVFNSMYIFCFRKKIVFYEAMQMLERAFYGKIRLTKLSSIDR